MFAIVFPASLNIAEGHFGGKSNGSTEFGAFNWNPICANPSADNQGVIHDLSKYKVRVCEVGLRIGNRDTIKQYSVSLAIRDENPSA